MSLGAQAQCDGLGPSREVEELIVGGHAIAGISSAASLPHPEKVLRASAPAVDELQAMPSLLGPPKAIDRVGTAHRHLHEAGAIAGGRPEKPFACLIQQAHCHVGGTAAVGRDADPVGERELRHVAEVHGGRGGHLAWAEREGAVNPRAA
jgi:hypothetical protein